MIADCMCGAVAFEITAPVPNLYQCHCTLCQKQSGTASNAATFVKPEQFRWLRGEDNIRSYKLDTGFRSDFCATCGCPVPNRLRELAFYWVPAGILQGLKDRKVVLHLHCGSKADWDSITGDAQCFSSMPDFDTIYQLLSQNVHDDSENNPQ